MVFKYTANRFSLNSVYILVNELIVDDGNGPQHNEYVC